MDYPATQIAFFEEEDGEIEDEEEEAGTPLRTNKKDKVAVLIAGSVNYPVYKGINKVGRINSCGIAINDNSVSKEHAEIEAGMGLKSTFISDLGSSNKTRINEAVLRPHKSYQIQDGDIIRFGLVKAIFKFEKTKLENSSIRYENFVVPETPAGIAKGSGTVNLSTGDISFEKSLGEENRSSDISLIAGSQDNDKNMRQRFYGQSQSNLNPENIDNNEVTDDQNDISNLETQNNISVDDSDEDNIFDMVTQKTDIHDDETQPFYRSNIKEGIQSQRCKKVTEIGSNSISINDLETQKPEVIFKDEEDSETDEEGLFEKSCDDIADMFDAPTQAIKAPRLEAPRTPDGVSENPGDNDVQKNTETIQKQEEIVVRGDPGPGDPPGTTESRKDEIRPETHTEIRIREEGKRATLNDSIESRLNHMFEEVDESAVEEPTQMLTQHLEKALESTQPLEEKGTVETSTIPNHNGTIIPSSSDETDDEEDDEDVVKSDDEFTKIVAQKIRVPKILSTQEIFGDLPAVNMLRTLNPSKKFESDGLGETGDVGNRAKSLKTVEILGYEMPSREDLKETKKPGGRKELPLKKRGTSITSDPTTPRKIVSEVQVQTIRITTRSNAKVSVEISKKLTHSSARESPRRSIPKSSIKGPESPSRISQVKKTETFESKRVSTRSKRGEDHVGENCPGKSQKILSSPRNSWRNKFRNNSRSVSDEEEEAEEASPVKKTKISTVAILPSTVNDRPRTAGKKEKEKTPIFNVPEVPDPDIPIPQNKGRPTRNRRAKPKADASPNDDAPGSSIAAINFDNATYQPSSESQEIQAILGVADQVEKEEKTMSARISRRNLRGNDFEKEGDAVLLGLAKTVDEKKFQKPVVPPERKKIQPRKPRRFNADEKNKETTDEEASSKRSKPRSKKNTEAANEDDLPSVVAAATSVKLKNEKIVTEKKKIKKETKISTQAATTPSHRGFLRRAANRAEKENVDEPPTKRVRRTKNETMNSSSASIITEDQSKLSECSSPLRRGRSKVSTPTTSSSSNVIPSARIKQRILFTGLNDHLHNLSSIVSNLGGTITEKPNDCTALVTDKVRRTYKFLCAMAMAVPIVSIEWLTESKNKGKFLETGDFLLNDPVEEAKFKFNLRRSLVMATDDKLLDGYTVILTPNVAPPPIAEMKSMIQACGGKVLVRPPTRWPENSLIISREEDIKNVKKFLSKAPESTNVLSVEFILTGILRHELNFEEHKLTIDN